jgi:hypothetical protein
MRVDIIELVTSVNSVLNDEDYHLYKHLDNGSTNNCDKDSAQGNKNISADVLNTADVGKSTDDG